MSYWIFVTNEQNWKVVKEKNVWGLPKGRENSIKRVKKGDKAFIYLMQEATKDRTIPTRIVGLFEVESDPFTSSERIFKDRLYPNRVRLKPILVLERKYLEFKPLVPKLSFIKNKLRWSGYFRSGLVKIPERDYNLIKTKISELV